MQPKRKKPNNDEIDLVEIFSQIWKNKFKFLLISFLPAVIMYFYLISKDQEEQLFEATTEIKPISRFEAYAYNDFSSYIDTQRYNTTIIGPYANNIDTNVIQFINYSSFDQIDRSYLLSLFMEKISEREFLIETLKKYNLIKKENFKSDQQYEKKLLEVSNSMKFKSFDEKGRTYGEIYNQVENKKEYENYLKLLEKSANFEIQKFLNKKFNDTIINQKIIQKYKIEDIEASIKLLDKNKDEKRLAKLKKQRQKILDNKDLKRLQAKFSTTPVMKSKEFNAATIITDTTIYVDLVDKSNITLKVITTFLASTVLGAFYLLFLVRIK